MFTNRLFLIQHAAGLSVCTDTQNSKEFHSTKTQVEGSPTTICSLEAIPLPMSCLLTDQGISPALLNRSPSMELPGDNLWPDITAAFTSAEILAPKHHYAASHRNKHDLFLQHVHTAHFPSPQYRAARVLPASSWFSSAAVLYSAPAPSAGWDKRISQPLIF